MEWVNLNLGGEDYSIEYYFDNDGILQLYSIQDMGGKEMYEIFDDETFEEIEQRIIDMYNGK